ncbi:hypothetical protein N6H14_14805 [Paenibacillus sp. CC-CFT747]|nr:hypothetical protein N6H14_14805 [Paenibacillus sp. CC-CFT747]
MGRFVQSGNGKGSLRAIQTLVNEYSDVFLSEIRKALPDLQTIDWVSPRRDDEMAEYRDEAFLKKLDIRSRLKAPLPEFWPKNGPQWDALGKTIDGKVFLVEAKANIPEIVSSGSKASHPSLGLIHRSLIEVRNALHITSEADWTRIFYQYTNRLAHLYFLRIKNNIPAYLINVYFIGDGSVDGPQTREEWLGAIQVMKSYLGLSKRHKLSPYMLDLFININVIGLE